MKRTVKLSKTAEIKLEKLLEYLLNNWSLKVQRNFILKLEENLERIKKHPEGFPISEKQQSLHKCVVTKQTTLYYTFTSKSIYIVTIFDNRQQPGKLDKEIK